MLFRFPISWTIFFPFQFREHCYIVMLKKIPYNTTSCIATYNEHLHVYRVGNFTTQLVYEVHIYMYTCMTYTTLRFLPTCYV